MKLKTKANFNAVLLQSESISPDTLRDQLRRASRQRDKTELERLIDEAEDAEYPELGHDLRKARETLESLGGGRGGQNEN